MKINDFSKTKRSENKYDVAIRMCYLIFSAIAVIVFVSLGLQYMKLWVWALSFVCCALGAAVYGTIAKTIITVIRRDLQFSKKVKVKSVLNLSYLVIFSIATIIFVATGIEGGSAKAWLISFVCSYGGAVIYSAIAKLIATLIRKEDK